MAKPSPAATFQLEFPDQAVSFDPEAFDLLIRTQGVAMVHFGAIPCVVGMIDADDERRPHEHHQECSNGFVYVEAGEITCGFLSNSKEVKTLDLGRMDGSTVQVIFPRYYDATCQGECVPVRPTNFDRIYLKDDKIDVPTWERFNSSESGTEKTRYPIVNVVYLMDSRGIFYAAGTDFDVVGGKVVWKNGGPGIDPFTKKGRVCSIRYTYRPFWYVQRMVHEVRVAQVENEFTGDRETVRFPQSMILQREQVFENEQRDKKLAATARTAKGPDDRGVSSSPDDLGVG